MFMHSKLVLQTRIRLHLDPPPPPPPDNMAYGRLSTLEIGDHLSEILLVCLFVCLLVCLHVCLLVCLLVCLFICFFSPRRLRKLSTFSAILAELRWIGPPNEQN